MHLKIDPTAPEPLFAQIVAGVKRAAAAGKLRPGERLPTVRELAAELVVNPNTVARAYQVLEAEGVTVSRRGAGTVLAERPAPVRAAERARELRADFDALLADAVHRGSTEDEVRAAFEAALRRVRIEGFETAGGREGTGLDPGPDAVRPADAARDGRDEGKGDLRPGEWVETPDGRRRRGRDRGERGEAGGNDGN